MRVERVATARESNAAAAAAGLWRALDTVDCGHPEIVRSFLAEVPQGQRIVDIGCWNGSIAALAAACIGGSSGSGGSDRDPAAAPWLSYTGIDLVRAAVDHFHAEHAARARTDAVQADVRALPIADGSADVVLCLFVLQDMDGYRSDGLRAIREIARIAHPGTRLLIALTVHDRLEEETHYVVKKLRREGIPEKPTHHWRGADFLTALRDSGLRITAVDGFGPNDRGFVELYVRAVAEPPTAERDRSRATVPVGSVPGQPALYVDYIRDFASLRSLFAWDYRTPESFVSAAAVVAERTLPRIAVADVLAEQRAVFGGTAQCVRNIDRLRDGSAVAIVTGQQPGLFGGPLYILYKAATAVLLTQRLESDTGRAHVPIFWIANDDHALSSVVLDEASDAALRELAASAHDSQAAYEARVLLHDTFRAGETLTVAFARLLTRLFERAGLVVVDPTDTRLRKLGMPALAAELDFPSPTAQAAQLATAQISALGYPVQVPLREDRLSLFYGRSQRFRLRASHTGFQMENAGPPVTASELRARFASTPDEFSPNVLLRPLYQDAILPTIAYVAGPSEIAYFAQLRPVYERFGLPMPIVYPRKSATLIDARSGQALAAMNMDLADVFTYVAALGPGAFWDGENGPAFAELVPEGSLQERGMGTGSALLAWGRGLPDRLLSELRLDSFDHQIIDVDG